MTPTLEPGAVVGGRYTIEAMLGRGGMATVYRAADSGLGRKVALKVFEIETEGATGLGRESSEIQLLASLNHHALVTLFDADIDGSDEVSYLVMELVEGSTLKDRIAAGPVFEIDVAQMVVDLAEALHVVHAGGVVHRDVKPANILLNPSALRAIEFRAKLSDFGIAYLIDSTRLTMPGTIIGTAAYLSPEQARGAAPGWTADVYSLGLVALEALTGVRAFEGTMVESISARLVSDPEIPAGISAAWRDLLSRMTARDPGVRPTALEVVESARAIERELYAGAGEAVAGGSGAASDDTLGETAAFTAATAAFPGATAATAFSGATAAMDPPTKVLPAPGKTGNDSDETGDPGDTTTVLPAAAAGAVPGAAPRAVRPALPRRILIAVGALLAAAVVGVVIWGAVAAQAPAPQTEPVPLPANEGVLGTHLDELLESVSP